MRTRRAVAPRTPTIRYVFAEDSVVAIKNAKVADPQRIGEALAAVAAVADGHLTPQATVEAARDPQSPLHPHFEWDDQVAADAYRLDQARHLIRLIRVSDDTRETDPPAFMSVNEGKAGTSYRTIGDVLNSVSLQDAVLKAAERDLLAFEQRYKRLEDICDIIRSAREKIAARRASASQEHHASA